jgi:hypothetical protein
MTQVAEAPTAAERAVDFRRLAWVLLAVSALLSLLSMGVPALIDHPLTTERGEIRMYLAVFEEGNLPTWWSTGLLVMTALAHAVVGFVARGVAWAWFVSAGMLALLSLDDHTALHERMERIGRQVVTFETFPAYWLIPGVLVGAVVAAALLMLAVRLTGRARLYMIAGCALLLGSAMGGELAHSVLYTVGESGPVYVLTLHAEELGENVGVLLMLAAAVRSVIVGRGTGGITVRYAG